MKILVTAGNTQTPIDRVRCITNIFTGRTGASIASEAAKRSHRVVLLTSHPDAVDSTTMKVFTYRTFEDLESQMSAEIPNGGYDAIIHVAAVSDYRLEGTYTLPEGSSFDPASGSFAGTPNLIDASRGKVRSTHRELWLRLTPTPKLVDRIRGDWNFQGVLVKFKLEVGIDENALQQVAAASRAQSDADYIVGNTLDGMHAWATIGDRSDRFMHVPRRELATQILDRVEHRQS